MPGALSVFGTALVAFVVVLPSFVLTVSVLRHGLRVVSSDDPNDFPEYVGIIVSDGVTAAFLWSFAYWLLKLIWF